MSHRFSFFVSVSSLFCPFLLRTVAYARLNPDATLADLSAENEHALCDSSLYTSTCVCTVVHVYLTFPLPILSSVPAYIQYPINTLSEVFTRKSRLHTVRLLQRNTIRPL